MKTKKLAFTENITFKTQNSTTLSLAMINKLAV